MRITREEVLQIAALARLALTDAEIALFQEQLTAILDYAASLQRLETKAIPPTTTVLPLHTALREDIPGQTLPQAEALGNAPHTQAGYFLVPQILLKEQL
ncbi:MAG: Asp-tRNA(Asn)/Glu-tRNA(Gln) amidotransferase subunit GatC [Anaerolineae bacterium]|nr:Asp-tRNA(Asn)/Glu-tRNA(Gln) amidotransferase subunit GatC [Anaerolineae bacterium]